MKKKSFYPLEYSCLEKETYQEVLCEIVTKFKDKVAVTDGTNELTYRDLDKQSSQLAYYFHKNNIYKDDKVIVQLPNSIEWLGFDTLTILLFTKE